MEEYEETLQHFFGATMFLMSVDFDNLNISSPDDKIVKIFADWIDTLNALREQSLANGDHATHEAIEGMISDFCERMGVDNVEDILNLKFLLPADWEDSHE